MGGDTLRKYIQIILLAVRSVMQVAISCVQGGSGAVRQLQSAPSGTNAFALRGKVAGNAT